MIEPSRAVQGKPCDGSTEQVATEASQELTISAREGSGIDILDPNSVTRPSTRNQPTRGVEGKVMRVERVEKPSGSWFLYHLWKLAKPVAFAFRPGRSARRHSQHFRQGSLRLEFRNLEESRDHSCQPADLSGRRELIQECQGQGRVVGAADHNVVRDGTHDMDPRRLVPRHQEAE